MTVVAPGYLLTGLRSRWGAPCFYLFLFGRLLYRIRALASVLSTADDRGRMPLDVILVSVLTIDGNINEMLFLSTYY